MYIIVRLMPQSCSYIHILPKLDVLLIINQLL